MEQISFDELEREKELSALPGRVAYIDECGNFGFDFDNKGTLVKYILCAVVAQYSELPNLHSAITKVKNKHGFSNAEIKSSSIGNNYKRRNIIISDLLPLNFRVILLVANKQDFVKNSPLTSYKKSFIKFLHQKLYNVLYKAYPKLKIIEDQTGSSEFQRSFKEYVKEHQPQNLFNEYDFEFVDSKDELFVQLADLIGGTISKALTEPDSPNYLEILKGKIMFVEEFPNKKGPYWGTASDETLKYDQAIYDISVYRARSYIADFENNENEEKKFQIAILRYLLFCVQNVSATSYISSRQLLNVLEEYSGAKIRLNYLYRRIIAPLRDAGVILASCSHGYKIPISVEDIITYINQTHTVVSPMLHRIEICRNLIKQQTSNNLDVLDDEAFVKYKRYFD